MQENDGTDWRTNNGTDALSKVRIDPVTGFSIVLMSQNS